MSKRTLGFIAAFLAASIFGLTFLFIKIGLRYSDPVHLLAMRFLLGMIVFEVLRRRKWIKLSLTLRNWTPLLLMVLFEPVCYFSFETYALLFSTSTEGGIFSSFTPVMTTIFAAVFLREYILPRQILFLGLSVFGIFFIMFLDGFVLSHGVGGKLLWISAVVSAALFAVCSRYFSRRYNPWDITYMMMVAGAVFFNSWSVGRHLFQGNLLNYFTPLISGPFLLSVAFLGIMASLVGIFFYNFGLSCLPSYQMSVTASLTTVVAIFAGGVFLNEVISWYHMVGAIIITIGVTGINLNAETRHKILSSRYIRIR